MVIWQELDRDPEADPDVNRYLFINIGFEAKKCGSG